MKEKKKNQEGTGRLQCWTVKTLAPVADLNMDNLSLSISKCKNNNFVFVFPTHFKVLIKSRTLLHVIFHR